MISRFANLSFITAGRLFVLRVPTDAVRETGYVEGVLDTLFCAIFVRRVCWTM